MFSQHWQLTSPLAVPLAVRRDRQWSESDSLPVTVLLVVSTPGESGKDSDPFKSRYFLIGGLTTSMFAVPQCVFDSFDISFQVYHGNVFASVRVLFCVIFCLILRVFSFLVCFNGKLSAGPNEKKS